MSPKEILVIKENGEIEPFNPAKLISSLEKSGTSARTSEDILRQVELKLKTGAPVKTKDIYRVAFGFLKKTEKLVAIRYSLKRAVLELGPSGFPFEKFIGEIFKSNGFEVKTGQIVMGMCVEHEVDFIASNSQRFLMGEAKFHNELGIKSDLKVALYVQARFEDIKKSQAQKGERQIDEAWLVTNTKFTDPAVSYANCKGLKMIGWDYPHHGNLHDLIGEAKIHPITCLTSLSSQEKKALLERGVVLCRSAEENRKHFVDSGMDENRINKAIEESQSVCV